jgi:hypothetical protein
MDDWAIGISIRKVHMEKIQRRRYCLLKWFSVQKKQRAARSKNGNYDGYISAFNILDNLHVFSWHNIILVDARI